MILLTNEDVEPLLTMPECILAIEAAFRDLGNQDAVDIPRQDAIVPNARQGAVHDLKTMSGSWPAAGIATSPKTKAPAASEAIHLRIGMRRPPGSAQD